MSCKVIVSEPFQVSFKGTVYRPGDVVEVPDDLARDWYSRGWVTEPKKKPRGRPTEARTVSRAGN